MLTRINKYLKFSTITAKLEDAIEMDPIWEAATFIRTVSQFRYQDVLYEAVYVELDNPEIK